jgi:hypothetical protein
MASTMIAGLYCGGKVRCHDRDVEKWRAQLPRFVDSADKQQVPPLRRLPVVHSGLVDHFL